MKILVIGGSGLIGTQLVEILNKLGHQAIAASPATGVNTLTGEGLADALNGTDVVVDVANSPSFEDEEVMKFFELSGQNIFREEKKSKIKHHVALSVVGTDRLLESGYLRAKQAQENIIKESGIPYSIVHATQFFEFLAGIANAATDGNTVRLSSAQFQPMASADVAAAVADITIASPINGIKEIAGPEQFSIAGLVELYLRKNNDPRTVIVDNKARYYGAELSDQMLLPGENARIGKINFASWYVNQPKKP